MGNFESLHELGTCRLRHLPERPSSKSVASSVRAEHVFYVVRCTSLSVARVRCALRRRWQSGFHVASGAPPPPLSSPPPPARARRMLVTRDAAGRK